MMTMMKMMPVYALSRTQISHGEVDGILKLKTVGSGYEISMHDQEVWVRALPWAQFLGEKIYCHSASLHPQV